MVSAPPQAIDVFDAVRKLGFPADDFLVAGSGIMAVNGIRDAYDLDVVVSPALFEKCKNEGWELRTWTREGRPGSDWLKRDSVELMMDLHSGDDDFSLEALKKDGVIVDGVWFLSLPQLVTFKREYGRPKDFQDIALIEEYLQTHPGGHETK